MAENKFMHTKETMTKTYRSRIGVSMLVIMGVIFLPALFVQEVKLLITLVVIFVCIVSCLFGIKYVIDGQTLKIYYFWGIHHDIDIETIKRIESTHSILSAPAASLNRLAIYYNKYDEIVISPRYQEDFIKHLTQINPNIQLQ